MQALHHFKMYSIQNGKGVFEDKNRLVLVMAIVGKYAMVRVKGAMPYVASLKELEIIK